MGFGRHGPAHRVESALEAALRVQDEIGGGDDALAFVQAARDHPARGNLGAHLDLARLEVAVALVDESVLARPGVEHRVLGDDEALSEVTREGHVDERLGSQLALRVGELHAHLDRPRLGVHERRDEGHPTSQELLLGLVRERDLGRLPYAHEGSLVLVDGGLDPHPREVDDGVEVHVRGDRLAVVVGHALGHDAVHVREDGDRARDLPVAFEGLDLGCRQVPELQTSSSGFEERLGALRDAREWAARQLALGPKREQVFLLARHQLGAVDREERLAPLDGGAHEVDEHVLDPPAHLRVHVRELRLVKQL